MADDNTQRLLQQAINTARAGKRAEARQLFQQVILQDRTSETAWLWMAALSDTAADKRKCLERVLQINPNNQSARDGLQRLQPASTTSASRTSVSNRRAAQTDNNNRVFGIPARSLIIYGGAAAMLVVGYFLISTLLQGIIGQFAITPIPTSAAISDAGNGTPPPPTVRPRATTTAIPLTAPSVLIDPASLPTLPATFTPTVTQTPTITPTPSQTPIPASAYLLYFVSYETGTGNPALFRANADGSNQRPLDIPLSKIAFSRDQTAVAFVGRLPDDTAETVYVGLAGAPAAARPIPNFSSSNISSLAWSPDGSRLAFIADDGNILYVYNSGAEGGVRALVQRGDYDAIGRMSGLDWSPDGDTLAVAATEGGSGFTEIYTLRLDNGALAQLTNTTTSSYAPAWSPDGSRLAYVSDSGGDGDIYIRDFAAGVDTVVTSSDGGAEDMAPAWSPDGAYLTFSSNRGDENRFHVYVVNLTSLDITQITSDDARHHLAPVFYP